MLLLPRGVHLKASLAFYYNDLHTGLLSPFPFLYFYYSGVYLVILFRLCLRWYLARRSWVLAVDIYSQIFVIYIRFSLLLITFHTIQENWFYIVPNILILILLFYCHQVFCRIPTVFTFLILCLMSVLCPSFLLICFTGSKIPLSIWP